ncbi:MAG: hypothetical protein E3J78_08745 [Candidatus Cloacimonadota bacterium]|nr:MAG: hypothetical protein E3J78_08745 [Candidatus Cloacimonadota bacterium]
MFQLLSIRIKSAFRATFITKTQNLVRIISYIFVVSCFLGGGGIIFYRIFHYLETVEVIGPILEKRLIGLAFLVFLTMIFLSSVITALSTFFRSKEVEFLMSLPLPVEKIFLAKFFENTFYCSWATVIAAVPLIGAFALSQKYPIGFYPLSLFALLLFVIIPSAAGVIVLMPLVNMLGRMTRRKLIYLVFIALAIFLIFLFISKPSILRVPYTADINEINAYVEQLRIENKFLPSDHLVKFIIEPFSQTSMRYLLLLLSTAIFSVALAYGIALGFYRKGWNCSFQSLSSGYKRRCSNVFYIILRVLKFPPRISALIVKDIRMFTRLPAQWGQSLIFFILLSTYIVSLRRTPLYEMVPLWFAIISFVNLGFTGYIVATLSARFVYPAISLEGRNISILLTSPLKRREFLREKFLISFIPNWLLAEFLIIFSNISLKSSVPFTLICAGITTVYALTIVSISMGLGALFPDFTESNPSKIAAGGGGILTAILSLFYIAISTAIISLPTRRFISSQFQQEPMHSFEFVVYVLLFILVSIIFSIVPLKAGMKSLQSMEI